jgi:glycosyltransferase involved in cell wall biosynthesis
MGPSADVRMTDPLDGAAADPPVVTVGLPVHDGERYLGRAIESILAQTFTDLELVISDNGSSDSTPEICAAYAVADPRVRVVRHATNRGAAWNYNYVLAAARGEYFKWIAHDDEYDPRHLEACLRVLRERSDVVLCYSKTRQIDSSGAHVRDIEERVDVSAPTPHQRFRRTVIYEGGCYHVFGVMRTDVLRATGGIGGFGESDRVLLAELSLHGEFAQVPDRLYFHREHEDRSIHRYPGRALDSWFDPRRARVITFPQWRLTWELVRAVERAGLPVEERIRTYLELRHWLRRHWRQLTRNLPGAAREWARRRKPPESGPAVREPTPPGYGPTQRVWTRRGHPPSGPSFGAGPAASRSDAAGGGER